MKKTNTRNSNVIEEYKMMKDIMITNKIYNMDCLEGLRMMPSDSVDLILSDPPYEMETKKGIATGMVKGSRYLKEIEYMCNGFDLRILDECVRVLKRINAFFFCSRAQIPMYFDYFADMNVNIQLLTWSKTDAPPLCCGKYLSDTVGKKFPYDFGGYPFDFNKMEMLANPTFIISMGDIQPIELKQFDHNQPIEFRVFRGTGNFEHYSLVLCKFNNLIQEFAFNPHLCKDALLEYMKNDANVFTVVVLEGTTKVVKILRALGFDDETKANLYSLWKYMLTKAIPQSEYENWYHSCWKYSTEQLWELAEPIGKWVSLY